MDMLCGDWITDSLGWLDKGRQLRKMISSKEYLLFIWQVPEHLDSLVIGIGHVYQVVKNGQAGRHGKFPRAGAATAECQQKPAQG